MCHQPLRIKGGDAPESVKGKNAEFASLDSATVFYCDQAGKDHNLHHQYIELVDGTVISVAWADELDRNELSGQHQEVRGRIPMQLPRLPEARKMIPSPKSQAVPKKKLVRQKLVAEDW